MLQKGYLYGSQPVLTKQFATYQLLDSMGAPVPLSNIKYNGSVKFDLDRFGATGLPIVVCRYNFTYSNNDGKEIFSNKNNNFTDAWPFKNGRAIVKRGQLYAIINTKGEFITPNLYDFIGTFSEGVAIVGVGNWDNGDFTGYTGFIDSTGRALSRISFQRAEPFKNGKARAWMNDKLFEFDFNGNINKVAPDNSIQSVINNYVNSSYTLSQNQYGYFENSARLKEKNTYFIHPCRIGDKWGYCDSMSRTIVAAQFDYAFDFSNDRALVSVHDKYSFIDNKGKYITTDWFDNADPFSEQIALVQVNDQYSYIGLDGKLLFPLNYKIRKFVGSIPKMEKLGRTGKLYCLSNSDGKPITQWLDRIDDFVDGKATVRRKDGLLSTIDMSGRQDSVWNYNVIYEGTIYRIVENQNRYAVINKIADTISNFVDDWLIFREGLTFAEKEGKWGYVNNKGEVIIPFEYDYAASFSEGLAIVGKKGMYYAIDKTGKPAFEQSFQDMYSYTEGLAAISDGKRWGYINKEGKIVIPLKYRAVTNFNEGAAAVKKGRYWGYIDKTGNIFIPCQFNMAGPFLKGLAWVKLGKEKMLVNKAGQLLERKQ